MKWIFAILFTCLPLAAMAQKFPALYDVVDVASDDVLNVRAGPESGTEIVDSLAPDETHIEVVGLSEDGKWGMVNVGEGSGWAYMRYLSRQPDQPLGSLDFPLSCYGTEPFWSLHARHASDVTFAMAGEPEVYLTSAKITNSMNTLHIFGMVASSPGAHYAAVIKKDICSDGMSDRAFGLEIDLVRKDGAIYSGCCSIAP